MSLFAEAYQRQTGKDLGLKGSESIKDLLKAMKDRKVKGDILTYAAQIASERAAPSLDAASKASQAEQGRFENAWTDLAVLASKSGVEEGFARIFRTLATGLADSNSMVVRLSEGFNQATIEFSKLALIPQSFSRALEGKQSQVADWLGADKINQLKTDLQSIGIAFDRLTNAKNGAIPFLNFGNVAQNTVNDVSVGAKLAGGAGRWYENASLIARAENQEGYDQVRKLLPGSPEWVAQGYGALKGNASTIMSTAEQYGSLITTTAAAWMKGEAPNWDKYQSPISYGNYINDKNPENAANMARDAAMNQAVNTTNSNNNFTVTVNLGVVGNSEQDFQRAGQVTGEWFRNELETTGLRFSKTQ